MPHLRKRRAVAPIAFVLVAVLFVSIAPTPAQQAPANAADNVASKLARLVATPAVSGYERPLSEKLAKDLAAFHPVTDNIGDVVITLGSGSPKRLIVASLDEPGFVVSEITPDGYLRVQRLPQRGLPKIYNELCSAQPIQITTAQGGTRDGVFAGLSIHLQPYGDSTEAVANPADINAMYVDVGASSAAEVRKAGIDLLDPLVLRRSLAQMDGKFLTGVSVGDRFGAAAALESLTHLDPAKITGTLTVAFVVQQRTGARGLQRILTTVQADELLYVGRLTPGGPVPGMEGVHHAARREPGSGVLIASESSNSFGGAFPAQLKKIADGNHTTLDADYSSALIPRGYLALPAYPAKSAHIGIAASWPDTPAETISAADLAQLASFLESYETGAPVATSPADLAHAVSGIAARVPEASLGAPNTATLLSDLTRAYGASTHEDHVRERVQALLPKWAKPETDDAGNLILALGGITSASDGAKKSPSILVVAHMDEIGYKVKTISNDGRLEVEELGSGIQYFYQGHPALIHTFAGDLSAIVELPPNWDNATFKWPEEGSELPIRVDAGARTPEEVAKLGIKIGDTITVPKAYRPLIGARANARSFDDRVGCAALIAAVWALGGPDSASLKNRNVTFVWSTGEELGLVGAAKLAESLADKHQAPDYVFAVDTFVSSDSPLESKRYADAEIGKGFVVRAVDSSNIVPAWALEKIQKLARANQIPIQYGVTSGGNDGSAFVRYGSLDVALGWPLRYSHSPAEVIDTRDVDSLARIITAVARSW
jgi:putative aminopeptidase